MTSRGKSLTALIGLMIALLLPIHVDCGYPNAVCPSHVGPFRQTCTRYELEPLGFYLTFIVAVVGSCLALASGMRVWVVALGASGCAAGLGDPTGQPGPASVRERLHSETRMILSTTDSGGTITAARKTDVDWESATVPLVVNNGEVSATTNPSGEITILRFGMGFEPITIPSTVIGKQAELTKLHVQIDSPVDALASWDDDDNVTLRTRMQLTLSWSLTVDGSPVPLGAPTLPLIPVQLKLSGDGVSVSTDGRMLVKGELWNWADIVKLDDLNLVVAADT